MKMLRGGRSVWLMAACCLLLVLAGCTRTYRGQRVYQGQVVSQDGKPIAGVRVTACFLGRSLDDHPRECAAARWKTVVLSGPDGEFAIAEPKQFVPGINGPSGPYDTNLLFERDGFESRELYWWRDQRLLSRRPLIVPVNRSDTSADTAPP